MSFKMLIAAVALGAALIAGPVGAAPLFFDDFESGLGAWTGKGGGGHHGQVVADPHDATNDVLSFTALNSAGDIYTASAFSAPAGAYVLSFDYLGLGRAGSVPGDYGGFAGWSWGLPGGHYWLAGTQDTYAGLFATLTDDGSWHHVDIVFSNAGTTPIHVMLEDFVGSRGVPGDAYFDNVTLAAVPEPGTLGLIVAGLLGLGWGRRRPRH